MRSLSASLYRVIRMQTKSKNCAFLIALLAIIATAHSVLCQVYGQQQQFPPPGPYGGGGPSAGPSLEGHTFSLQFKGCPGNRPVLTTCVWPNLWCPNEAYTLTWGIECYCCPLPGYPYENIGGFARHPYSSFRPGTVPNLSGFQSSFYGPGRSFYQHQLQVYPPSKRASVRHTEIHGNPQRALETIGEVIPQSAKHPPLNNQRETSHATSNFTASTGGVVAIAHRPPPGQPIANLNPFASFKPPLQIAPIRSQTRGNTAAERRGINFARNSYPKVRVITANNPQPYQGQL